MSYPLKLLVSEGRLSIAAAGKDPATGKLVTNTYEVAGPVALAHQHQRERKQVVVGGRTVTYIEATEADVTAIERLCVTVLGTTADEMSPVTRRLLDTLGAFVSGRSEPTFTRRELREATGFGDTQLKAHLARLVDLEYVMANRAGPSTTYELAAQPHVRPDRSASGPDRSAIGRPPIDEEKQPSNSNNGSFDATGRPCGHFAGQERPTSAS